MPATIDDYLNLVTSEHRDKPKFVDVLTTVLQPFVDGRNLLASVPLKFDLDLAVGQQLDFIGQWVGLTRGLLEPINGVYFALDTVGLGFDQGVWFGPGDPSEGIVTLDDATYRYMLKIKIASNYWNGTLEDAQRILNEIINPGGTGPVSLFLEDNFDMTMTLGVVGIPPSQLFLSLLEHGYITIRPAGVKIESIETSPGPIFGFDNDNYLIGGFDHGLIDGNP